MWRRNYDKMINGIKIKKVILIERDTKLNKFLVGTIITLCRVEPLYLGHAE